MVTTALVLLALLAAAVAVLWAAQEKLTYFPRRYAAERLAHPPRGLVVVRDPQRTQAVLGFYRAPQNGIALERLWLVFGGNGDLALDWDAVLRPSATHGRGFLLVEYLGYGARPGEPSPENIRRAALESVSALAATLGTTPAELDPQIAVLGYSLGTAAALDYAARHPSSASC